MSGVGALSFGFDREAPSLMDPKQLTEAERRWIRRIAMFKHYRRRGGWGLLGDPHILSLRMARRLQQKRIIIGAVENGRQYVRLSGLGQNVLAIMDERERAKRQKAGAS
ncbi:hypothetical protein M1D80_11935 [Phyllobacteriaceae bacterium JZ32]